MIKYNYFGDEASIYYEKLNNGLDVYVAPNNKKGNYYIELVVRYGSNIKEFRPLDKSDYIHLPLGVAHFLEHKIFDTEDGDVFSFYSKTGTYINAGTNYFCTKYYIDGKKDLKKNLDYLLTMIYTPYFIPSRVDSEKAIIAEEIKMYDDEANWILDYETKKCLFKTAISDKIAGTCDSIMEIDSDLLTDTYNTFYQPSNMFLVACGNVNYKDILEVIKNNQAINNRITNKKIEYKKEIETKEVSLEYKYLEANVIIPKLIYSYKFDLNDFSFSPLMTRLYLSLLFTHLFGEASLFNEKIINEKIALDFYMDHLSFDNIYALTLEAESEYADLFKDEVDKTIQNIKITLEEFIRIKKIWISVVIRSLDNKENLAYSITDDIIKDNRVHDQHELIEKMNYEELLQIIEEIDWNNKAFVLMMPKEK